MAEHFYRRHRASPPAVIVVFEGGSPNEGHRQCPPHYLHQQREQWTGPPHGRGVQSRLCRRRLCTLPPAGKRHHGCKRVLHAGRGALSHLPLLLVSTYSEQKPRMGVAD